MKILLTRITILLLYLSILAKCDTVAQYSYMAPLDMNDGLNPASLEIEISTCK